MKKIRIVNDGQPAYATKITDAETGESIDSIYRLSLAFDINDKHNSAFAVLWMYMPKVDVTIDAEVHQSCPYCGREKDDA